MAFDFPFTHKICASCKQNKSIEEFCIYYQKERKKYRIAHKCKYCANELAKKKHFDYYPEHKEHKQQYAKKYRDDPQNRQKLKESSRKFKAKYRQELADFYVRSILLEQNKIPIDISKELPEIVEAKRLEIQIKRKIKSLKNGKK